ncbi:transcriptional modulator of MazE/toxin, MazF [Rhodococcus ruber BKS 20-38]|uniref:Transcriptional modulator of MazE/toxin, MazF n=1 Tax=Rhodococcus ruber BKS 20-38 TaxID=1278076 RepID=M2YPJ5_9NOCA|nr:transcriptional modulator of MazE/toxin, MazF [Rhodococcus ruber BKS 20-38]
MASEGIVREGARQGAGRAVDVGGFGRADLGHRAERRGTPAAAASSFQFLTDHQHSHVFPFQVLVEPDESGLARASKAQAEQVRSVSVRRLDTEPVGKLGVRTLAALEEALRLHLDLR